MKVTVSVPAPPSMISVPYAVTYSVLALSVKVSLPAPPDILSRPSLPSIVSAPSPPAIVSLTVPPSRASAPPPPITFSGIAEASPVKVNLSSAAVTVDPSNSEASIVNPAGC